MKKALLLFIFLTGLLAGCHREEIKVAYLNFSESTAITMDVSTFNQEHGTNYDASELASIANQKFPDLWVYANAATLGTWEMPCKVPVIFNSDSTVFSLFPGVKLNGVSTMRPRYPFVNAYSMTASLHNGEILDVENITFKYAPTTHFEFIENFTKDYNSVFHPSKDNGINFEHIADPEEPINRIGRISMDVDSITEFEVISSDMTFGNVLPADIFLEMDYRCDVESTEFTVTMLVDKSTTSVTTSEPLVVANAGPQWKKIYVNLTKSVHRNSLNAINYRVQLSGGRDDSNPVHLYFDNIKVIYITSY